MQHLNQRSKHLGGYFFIYLYILLKIKRCSVLKNYIDETRDISLFILTVRKSFDG